MTENLLPHGVFLKGETVIWAPTRVRQKCYGHPIGIAHVACEIQNGPDSRGNYNVKILDKAAKVWLRKSSYTVMAISLRKDIGGGK